MPFAYPHRAHLKLDILARVAAGERLKAEVCAAPDMPDYVTVYLWGRADPAFAAELREARRVGDWRRRSSFDEARAKVVIARLAAGETLRQVVADPAMPSRRTLAHWRACQASFAEALHQVKGLRAEAWRFRNQGRWRVFDPALADRILARVVQGGALPKVLASDPALPSPKVLARWRRENREFDRLLTGAMVIGGRVRRRVKRRSPRCTEALIETIMQRIIYGASLASLGREPHMPSASTLRAWKRRDPEFARALAIARMGRDDLRDDMRLVAAQDAHARATARRAAP
jgi:hypothetical protein